MTNKETVRKNIELTFDFVRQIIDEPHIAQQLPDKCDIDFIEKDFTLLSENDLKKKNLIKVNHTFEIIKNKKLNGSNGNNKVIKRKLKQ
ncbi:MAG: hypothetical protein ABI840_06840 [bacterium]